MAADAPVGSVAGWKSADTVAYPTRRNVEPDIVAELRDWAHLIDSTRGHGLDLHLFSGVVHTAAADEIERLRAATTPTDTAPVASVGDSQLSTPKVGMLANPYTPLDVATWVDLLLSSADTDQAINAMNLLRTQAARLDVALGDPRHQWNRVVDRG